MSLSIRSPTITACSGSQPDLSVANSKMAKSGLLNPSSAEGRQRETNFEKPQLFQSGLSPGRLIGDDTDAIPFTESIQNVCGLRIWFLEVFSPRDLGLEASPELLRVGQLGDGARDG